MVQLKKATLCGFEPATLKTKVYLRLTDTVATDCATLPSTEPAIREDIDLLSVIQDISIYRSIHGF